MNLPASEVTRFMFEELDICGAVVRLSDAWRQMHEARDYPHQVQHLLGEMTAVAAMIGSNFKQPGRLTFQAQGQGALSLLVVDCEEVGGQLLLRGMARCAEELAQTPQSLRDLLGEGHLLFSLHGDAAEPPYQSFVALEGHSIAEIFEGFMSQSAQQPARLWLFADETLATGLFLQTLPPRPLAEGAVPPDADGWNRVQQLAATLRAGDLHLPVHTLLSRLFAEETLRVFDPCPVTYYCPRDEGKVRAMLTSLGREEVAAILAEQGEILIRDEICNHEYRFGQHILDELFSPPGQALH